MKQLLSIFLLVSFTAQSFNQGLILVSFYVNPSSFAIHCENQAKPMMHCNGKCQVMKKLKQEEKKDEQNGDRKLTNKIDTTSCKSFFASIPIVVLQSYQPYGGYCSVSLLHGIPSRVFHPPGLA